MSALYEQRAKKDSLKKPTPALTGQALKDSCISGCSGTSDKNRQGSWSLIFINNPVPKYSWEW